MRVDDIRSGEIMKFKKRYFVEHFSYLHPIHRFDEGWDSLGPTGFLPTRYCPTEGAIKITNGDDELIFAGDWRRFLKCLQENSSICWMLLVVENEEHRRRIRELIKLILES